LKKRFFAALAILIFSLIPASAAPVGASENVDSASKNLIIDDMSKISDGSMAALDGYAREISGAYGLDVAFFLPSHDYSPRQYFREHIRERYHDMQGLGPDGFALAYDIDGARWDAVGFGRAAWIVTNEVRYRLWDAYWNASQETGATYYDGAMAYLKEAEGLLAELAAAHEGDPLGGAQLSFIEDKAALLLREEREELEARAAEIAALYQCGIYVVIVDDMYDFDYGYRYDSEDAFVFNTALKSRYHLGADTGGSCVILCLSMEDRDYWLEAYGPAMWDFTDYGIDEMLDRHILPKLGENMWYEAFSAYLDRADLYLRMARDGAPFDRDTDPAALRKILLQKLAVVLLLPMFIASVICSIWKKQMKTAALARTADSYIPKGGFNLTGQTDEFIYRNTTRRQIVSSSVSSPSSSRSSSSSRSHGSSRGRGGKF